MILDIWYSDISQSVQTKKDFQKTQGHIMNIVGVFRKREIEVSDFKILRNQKTGICPYQFIKYLSIFSPVRQAAKVKSTKD